MAQPCYDASVDRQALHRLVEELAALIHAFCDHQPLVQGRLQKLSRRCGKTCCRCARGALHRSTVLVDRRGERPSIRKVSPSQYRRLLAPTREYHKLRERRARLCRLHHEMLRTCDRLTKCRLEEGSRLHSSATRSP